VQIVRPDDHVVEGNAHPLLPLYLLQAGQLAVPLQQNKNQKSMDTGTPKLEILEIHDKPYLDTRQMVKKAQHVLKGTISKRVIDDLSWPSFRGRMI
jgi:hypothetical protein